MCSSFNLGRLIIACVLVLISVIAYSSQITIFWSFLGGPTLRTFLVLAPLNILVILIYVNYYLALSTDPGAVPAGWEPPFKNRQVEVKRSTHQPRYCKTCNVFKPPRSHHCRQCGRCVLKMDHHCPWINNCVGHRNYGHFLRFILTVDVATLYVLVLLCWRVAVIMDDMKNFRYNAEPQISERVFLVINFALDLPVLFCVGALSGYHIYCVSTNTTTIEGWEKGKVATMVRRGKIQDVKFPYDVGMYKNIKQVLGDNPLLWFIPQFAKGDGLSFAIAKDTDPIEAYFWPPRDPEDNRPSIFSARYKRQARKRQTTRNQNIPFLPSQSQPYYSHNQDPAFLDENISSQYYIQNPDDNTQAISTFNNYTNSSDTHVNELTQFPPNQYPPSRPRRHIRRDSEGYIVREITSEERQHMLRSINLGPYGPRPGQQPPLLNFEDERGRRGAPVSVAMVNGEDEDVEDEFDDYYDSASAYSYSSPEFTESEEEEGAEGYYRAGYDDERRYYYDGERREHGTEAGIPLREVEGRREKQEWEAYEDKDVDDERVPLAVIAKKHKEAMGWAGVGMTERKGKED